MMGTKTRSFTPLANDVSLEDLVPQEHFYRRLQARLDPVLYESNMSSLSLTRRYEAIIVPAGSFLLIERREESLGALRRFREHLIPGGRLILDIELQTDFRTGSVSTRTWETPRGETITLESKLVEVNFLEQYTVSHLRYEKWRGGELMRTELQHFPMRWYGLEEFKLVLRSVGFSDVVVFADYEYGRRRSRADQTFTFEARHEDPITTPQPAESVIQE
jgi:hypothetical protein